MAERLRMLEFQAEVLKQREARYTPLDSPQIGLVETCGDVFIRFDITAWVQGSSTQFFGTHAKSQYFIEFMPLSDLSALRLQLQAASSRKPFNKLVRHLNRWHTYFRTTSFVFAVFTPATPFISVAEWQQTLSVLKLPAFVKARAQLSVEMIVKFALFLSKAIFEAHFKGLVLDCVTLENCYFHATEEDIEFALDIANPRTEHVTNGSQAKDLRDLGVVLFALCSWKTDLQELHLKTRAELEQLLSESRYVPGLTELVVSLLSGTICSAYELLFSQVLRVWRHILKGATSKPLADNMGWLTGLYFDSDRTIVSCLEVLAKESPALIVHEYTRKPEFLQHFIQVLVKYATATIELRCYSIEVVSLALSAAPTLNLQARKCEVYRLLTFLSPGLPECPRESASVVAFLKTLTANNTLTALYIGRTADFIMELVRLHVDDYFLQFLPYFCSPSLAQLPAYIKCIPGETVCLAMNLLAGLPMHRKRPELDAVAEILIASLVQAQKKKITTETLDMLQLAVEVVYQVFVGGHRHYQANLEARCFKETQQFACEPAVATCSCGETLCFWCTQEHAQMGHQFDYVLYMNSHPRLCTYGSDAQGDFVFTGLYAQTVLPLFTDSDQTGPIFSTSAECPTLRVFSIDQVHLAESVNPVVFYYEVTVLSGGYSDNVSVGLDWIGSKGKEWVQYHGRTGNITKYGQVVGKAPRFGTSDRVGVGCLLENVVFFTFNGYNTHIYIRTKPVPNVIPLIQLKGQGLKVTVHLDSFLFGSAYSCSDALVSRLKDVLTNWGKKLIKFKPKDSATCEKVFLLVEAAEHVKEFTQIKLEYLRQAVYQQKNWRHAKTKDRCQLF